MARGFHRAAFLVLLLAVALVAWRGVEAFSTSDWRKLRSSETEKTFYAVGFRDGYLMALHVSEASLRTRLVDCMDRRKFSGKELVALVEKELFELERGKGREAGILPELRLEATGEELEMRLVMGLTVLKACGS